MSRRWWRSRSRTRSTPTASRSSPNSVRPASLEPRASPTPPCAPTAPPLRSRGPASARRYAMRAADRGSFHTSRLLRARHLTRRRLARRCRLVRRGRCRLSLYAQRVDLSNPAVALTGASQFNLVLAAGALTAGATYTFQLNVTTTNPSGRGLAQITFIVNAVNANGARDAVASPRDLTHYSRKRSCTRSRRATVLRRWTRQRACLARPPSSSALQASGMPLVLSNSRVWGGGGSSPRPGTACSCCAPQVQLCARQHALQLFCDAAVWCGVPGADDAVAVKLARAHQPARRLQRSPCRRDRRPVRGKRLGEAEGEGKGGKKGQGAGPWDVLY